MIWRRELLRKIIQKNGLIENGRLFNTSVSILKSKDKPLVGTTIDKHDVAHHAKYGNFWWDPSGHMKALHSMNEIRVPFIRDGLVKHAPPNRTKTPLFGKRILDVGCGGGILSEPLARLGASVTGIDASEELIYVAKNHACTDHRIGDNLPEYICTPVEQHALSRENYYDAVVASEIVEHVDNKLLFLESCVKLLKLGGKIFITTPSRTRLAQFGAIFLAENILNIVPKGSHQYEKFMTPTELSFMLGRMNCHVDLIHGAFYNFALNKWTFMDSTAFVFFLQATKSD